MDTLTDGQLRALRNLAEKHTGNVTAFLNIADAQHLTQIGFASRTRQGWDITSAGAAHLAGVQPSRGVGAEIAELRPIGGEVRPGRDAADGETGG